MSTHSSGRDGVNGAERPVTKFPDFDVSWAGPGRDDAEFGFGSVDGRILLTDERLNPIGVLKESPVPSGEAINGLAFMNDVIALSTRSEVVFVTPHPAKGEGFRSVFPAGAHGVVATLSGRFVAPLGRGGILVVKPSSGKEQLLTIKRASHKPIHFYRAANITYRGGEVVACAARFDGVAALQVSSDGAGFVSSLTYPGLDVVDVCSLGRNLAAPAVAAVSKDCTLILSRDALYDPAPATIKFDEIKGTAYRVLNYDGNLLLLTSRAVYVFAGLSRRFLGGESVGLKPTPVKEIILEGVDAAVVGDRSLVVVAPDGVIPFDLPFLIGKAPSAEPVDEDREANPTEMSPLWQPHRDGLESENRVLSGVG